MANKLTDGKAHTRQAKLVQKLAKAFPDVYLSVACEVQRRRNYEKLDMPYELAEVWTLYISTIHESLANSGTSFCEVGLTYPEACQLIDSLIIKAKALTSQNQNKKGAIPQSVD